MHFSIALGIEVWNVPPVTLVTGGRKPLGDWNSIFLWHGGCGGVPADFLVKQKELTWLSLLVNLNLHLLSPNKVPHSR